MLELLNYKSKRLLNIMELLILESGFVSLKQIENKNNCSNKTVYDDLHYLQDEFRDSLRLIVSHNNIKSYGFTMYEYEQLKNRLINDSIHFKILIELAFNGPLTVSDLSWQFNYSESRIRNVIDELNKHLNLYEIKLVSINGIFYFNTKNIETLIILLEKILSFELKNYLSESCEINYSDAFFNNFEPLKSLVLPKLIHEQLKNYYYIYFNIARDCIISKTKSHNFIKNISDEENDILQLRSTLKDIPFTINNNQSNQIIAILNYYKFILRICNHRIIREYNRYDYFYEQFSEENHQIVTIFENYLLLLEEKLGDNFISYKEEILFHIYTSVRSLRVYEKKCIGVYSDLCCCHAASIVQSIKKHFPMHEIVNLYKNKSNEIDLIVTTKILTEYLSFDQVLISDFLTIDDIYHIYSAIYHNDNKTVFKQNCHLQE